MRYFLIITLSACVLSGCQIAAAPRDGHGDAAMPATAPAVFSVQAPGDDAPTFPPCPNLPPGIDCCHGMVVPGAAKGEVSADAAGMGK